DVLYAGISSNCMEESVSLAKFSFDAGADVVVATLPSYYLLTESEMCNYFEQLADRMRGPLIIYNIPSTTHMSIPLNVIDELSYHENIVGLKDSERNEERLKDSSQRWSRREDFSFFSGWAAKSAATLLGGGDGVVPSTGNLYPGLYRELYKAAQEGNIEKTEELQNLSDLLGELYQKDRILGQSLWALKVLMQEVGLCQSYVMPPLQRQSEEEANRLRQQLQEMKNREKIKLF
ncbi:MAG: dihydrodipicolinate synthase family protein, partial [Bacteroidota bacterium]|nr:dihydrodipicolinate synthase family protein [Bacteroidota bacterium]